MQPIEQLKKYLIQSKELSEPLNYFFDLDEKGYFLKDLNSRPVKDFERVEVKCILDTIKTTAQQKLGLSIKKVSPILSEIKAHHFLHGMCLVPDAMLIPVTVMLFTDIQTGLIALCTDQSHIVRFSFVVPSEIGSKH